MLCSDKFNLNWDRDVLLKLIDNNIKFHLIFTSEFLNDEFEKVMRSKIGENLCPASSII